jgi:hypothetical protein
VNFRIRAWQDKHKRRRLFDGVVWFDAEAGESVIVIIGKDLDARVMRALGVATDDPDEAK